MNKTRLLIVAVLVVAAFGVGYIGVTQAQAGSKADTACKCDNCTCTDCQCVDGKCSCDGKCTDCQCDACASKCADAKADCQDAHAAKSGCKDVDMADCVSQSSQTGCGGCPGH